MKVSTEDRTVVLDIDTSYGYSSREKLTRQEAERLIKDLRKAIDGLAPHTVRKLGEYR